MGSISSSGEVGTQPLHAPLYLSLWTSWLPLWQSDADVPQGMENLLTAPLVRKEEAEPVRGSLVGLGWWIEPQAPPLGSPRGIWA